MESLELVAIFFGSLIRYRYSFQGHMQRPLLPLVSEELQAY